jgi:hypothetical protein
MSDEPVCKDIVRRRRLENWTRAKRQTPLMQAMVAWYWGLSVEERANVDYLMLDLQAALRRKHEYASLGDTGALELLGAIIAAEMGWKKIV